MLRQKSMRNVTKYNRDKEMQNRLVLKVNVWRNELKNKDFPLQCAMYCARHFSVFYHRNVLTKLYYNVVNVNTDDETQDNSRVIFC